MRRYVLFIVAIALALMVSVQPAAALPILRVPYVRAGPVWALNPSEVANLEIIEFNASRLAAVDTGAFSASLGTAGIFSFGGPAFGSTFTASGPTIGQTSSRSLFCDATYFYQDFLGPA